MTYKQIRAPRACKACARWFTPRRRDQQVCRPNCRKRLAKQMAACRELGAYYDQPAGTKDSS
jgi:hypothetical protein